jgi:hypothetical protein
MYTGMIIEFLTACQNPSFNSCGQITENPGHMFRPQKTIALVGNMNVVSVRGMELRASSVQLHVLCYVKDR